MAFNKFRNTDRRGALFSWFLTNTHYKYLSAKVLCIQQAQQGMPSSSGANFALWLRVHDEFADTPCRLHAAGNQLQTVEQRRTAVSGVGGAEERPSRSLVFTQGKASITVMPDGNYTLYLINSCCNADLVCTRLLMS